MEAETFSHLMQRIAAAPINEDPFPHFHIEGIFPETFYAQLLENLPDTSFCTHIDGYPKRFYFHLEPQPLELLPFSQFLFWQNFAAAIRNRQLALALLEKFHPQLKNRWGENFQDLKFGVDASVVRDQSEYFIGPHTDHPHKILTLLFYLPTTYEQKHLGTSLYLPKDRTFTCSGNGHHAFQDFDKVSTAPFVPNSVFGFLKSDTSFHGVEPIGKQEKERISFAYTIWEKK